MDDDMEALGDKLMADIQAWWDDYDWDAKWIQYMENQ